MKIIYTRIAAAAALETGIIANPDYYENPNLKAKEVIIYGNYPKIQKDYESLEVPVEVRKLEEPQNDFGHCKCSGWNYSRAARSH